jgi:predicted anti-sigma-YlaC factor YlaD
MLTLPNHACERARALVSLRLDGELSTFESAELQGHLAQCESCRAYDGHTEAFTTLVRTTPLQAAETPFALPRRQRLALKPLQVGAAAALLAVLGLGSAAGVLDSRGVLPGLGLSDSQPSRASSVRPAYLDSADYELSLIRRAREAHAPNGSAVPL